MKKRIKSYPDQAIIGFALIGVGFWLMHFDHYFVWPPFLIPAANDDVVGGIFIGVGIAMWVWVLSRDHPAAWNRWLLTSAAYLMGALGVYQLLHFLVLGMGMPFITNLEVAGLIILLAKRSDASDD